MGEIKKEVGKEGRTFRKPRWAPGQEERAKAVAEKLIASGKSRDELVASGDLIPAGTMGEFVAASYAAYQLKAAREAAGLSLPELEARTGMDRSALCRLENGQTNPTMQTIARYAAALGKQIRLVLEDMTPQGDEGGQSPAPAH